MGSFILLWKTELFWSSEHDQQDYQPIQYFKNDSTKIDFHFLNELDESDNEILALGISTSNVCSGCINELLEYSKAIDEVNNSFTVKRKILKKYIIIGTDSTFKKRFKLTYDILEEVYFLNHNEDKTLAETLSIWEDTPFNSQWIFINMKTTTISGRILVLNTITPYYFKKNLVGQAFFASDNS